MSFALGALTIEQAKHLAAADAGALAGLTSLPSLRTWRQRLGELAGPCAPLAPPRRRRRGPGGRARGGRAHPGARLALRRGRPSKMPAIEPAESQVYLADDHI